MRLVWSRGVIEGGEIKVKGGCNLNAGGGAEEGGTMKM